MTTALAPAAKAPQVTLAEDGRAVTSSRNIAEVFGKRHADVLRAIEKLECSVDFHERNFALMIADVAIGKVRIRQLPLLHRQSRQLLAGLKREADQDQRRNLYWALHRVNCALGIPVPSMQALGVQRPEVAALELPLDDEQEPRA